MYEIFEKDFRKGGLEVCWWVGEWVGGCVNKVKAKFIHSINAPLYGVNSLDLKHI